MTQNRNLSRRKALARLGLGFASAYMTPTVVGLSTARAASGVSDPTPPSAPSPASSPTPPSSPSPASPPSNPTTPSAASQASSPSQPGSSQASSGPSGPGACRQSTLQGGGQITRNDYEQAQQAISRGDARPLREVLNTVQSQHPGRIVSVGFSQSGRSTAYRVLIISSSGAVLSITVNARTGQITRVQSC